MRGPNREGVRIKSSDISDSWDCIKLFEKVTRYSGRRIAETLNTSVVGNEIIICRCVDNFECESSIQVGLALRPATAFHEFRPGK
jgi:hypothetical protein